MKHLLLFLSLPLLASIDGVVINRTTGLPQPGVTVLLTKLGQGGMTPAGTAKSGPDGKFHLEASAQDTHLLQAMYEGVTYNLQLPPRPVATALQVPVYEATAKPIAAPDQDMILVETDGQEMVVRQTVIYKNDGNETWNDPQRGTLHFFAPAEAGENVRVRAMAPGGMPIERQPKKTAEKEVWKVDYPVRPGGETRFDISYKMPVKQPIEFRTVVLHAAAPTRLVLPQGLTASGDGIKPLGEEPQTHASIFDITKRQLKLTLSGTGQLNTPQATQPTDEDGPQFEQIQPPGFARNRNWILGLMLGILALSFAAQFLKGAPSKR